MVETALTKQNPYIQASLVKLLQLNAEGKTFLYIYLRCTI